MTPTDQPEHEYERVARETGNWPIVHLGADDGRPLEDHERSRCTAGHVRQMQEEYEALVTVITNHRRRTEAVLGDQLPSVIDRDLWRVLDDDQQGPADDCPLERHLRFYGPHGAYCGACKVALDG